RPLAREVHVGVDREADPGEHVPLGDELLARHAEGLAQAQPRLDPARPLGRAVVVDDPLDPLAAHLDLGAVGEDGRVLDRDALLVVEAVGDPALQLVARELARVHPHVERVQVVVARALRAQTLDEVVPGPGGRLAGGCRRAVDHRSVSWPSYAGRRRRPGAGSVPGQTNARVEFTNARAGP